MPAQPPTDVWGIIVRRAILGCDDVSGFLGYCKQIGEIGLPWCDIQWLRSRQACGFITCPSCELVRRINFGIAIGAAALDHGALWMVHTRRHIPTLYDFAEVVSPAIRRHATRRRGLIGWRRCCGFDAIQQQWVADHIAIYSEPADASGPGVTTATPDTYPPSPEPSMTNFYGQLSGFVVAAATIGMSPLATPAATDDPAETRRKWLTEHRRMRLVHIPRIGKSNACSDESE